MSVALRWSLSAQFRQGHAAVTSLALNLTVNRQMSRQKFFPPEHFLHILCQLLSELLGQIAILKQTYNCRSQRTDSPTRRIARIVRPNTKEQGVVLVLQVFFQRVQSWVYSGKLKTKICHQITQVHSFLLTGQAKSPRLTKNRKSIFYTW